MICGYCIKQIPFVFRLTLIFLGYPSLQAVHKTEKPLAFASGFFGAGDETRTHTP